MEGLHIDGVLHGETLANAGFVELLTAAEFFYDTGSFKLSLKLFEGAFDVLAFLYGYYNHLWLLYFYCFVNRRTGMRGAKVRIISQSQRV